MKVLFIGPYRQNDGWGDAAKNYCRALAKTEGVELAIRPIYMGRNFCDVEEDLMEYEFNDFREYDVVIQNVLPHYVDYNYECGKNILLFYSETKNLQWTSWPDRANLMDEVWVPSSQEKENLVNSGVSVPIQVVPIPLDVTEIHGHEDTLALPLVDEDSFVFYTIGEFVQRKNLTAFATAFHSEFDPSENVHILVKTHKGGAHPQQTHQEVANKINSVKTRLRMYQKLQDYKNDIVVANYLDRQSLMSVHNSCDCFVAPSHGESWCIPALEAMAAGNPAIVTSGTGMTEFVNNQNGWVVGATDAPCLVKDAPLPYLYTGRETWREINIMELRYFMREAYENRDLYKKKSEQAKKDSLKYAPEEVAKVIKEVL
jgi:glycosyltransferase involved in cell wall biosynthesis